VAGPLDGLIIVSILAFRSEVRNIDGFTCLKGSPQLLFNEVADVVVKGGRASTSADVDQSMGRISAV
jgi:hypothetical protein